MSEGNELWVDPQAWKLQVNHSILNKTRYSNDGIFFLLLNGWKTYPIGKRTP